MEMEDKTYGIIFSIVTKFVTKLQQKSLYHILCFLFQLCKLYI
jgi:hypothetical protein